jgi:hypothetical protein
MFLPAPGARRARGAPGGVAAMRLRRSPGEVEEGISAGVGSGVTGLVTASPRPISAPARAFSQKRSTA